MKNWWGCTGPWNRGRADCIRGNYGLPIYGRGVHPFINRTYNRVARRNHCLRLDHFLGAFRRLKVGSLD